VEVIVGASEDILLGFDMARIAIYRRTKRKKSFRFVWSMLRKLFAWRHSNVVMGAEDSVGSCRGN
jgi:hypothetical protein